MCVSVCMCVSVQQYPILVYEDILVDMKLQVFMLTRYILDVFWTCFSTYWQCYLHLHHFEYDQII